MLYWKKLDVNLWSHVWQVCGEAQYVDDLKMHNMLHGALVVSSRPHAKILSVDASAATNVAPSASCY